MPKKTSGEGTVSSEVQGDMDNLEQTVGKIEKYLEPFFKTSLKETKNNLSGLEVAKLNIVIAYAINTLFYSINSSPFCLFISLFFNYHHCSIVYRLLMFV